MEVVLLERIRHLGQMGDVVAVKKGYARNFLIPQGKALRSTPENRERFERERATIEARDLELRHEAEGAAEKISGLQVDVIRQASEAGTLYGSVSSRDIADACKEQSINVERRQIELERPIKSLGMHTVQVVLHPEVTVPMVVCVARSQEEAQLQARGIISSHATDSTEKPPAAEQNVTAKPPKQEAAATTTDTDEAPSSDSDPAVPDVTTAGAEATTDAAAPTETVAGEEVSETNPAA